MQRTIATHLALLMIGIAVGIGAVAVADPGSPPVARSSAADSRIVQRLDVLNTNVRGIERQLGGYPDTNVKPTNSVLDVLKDIKSDQVTTCRALAERSYDCPLH